MLGLAVEPRGLTCQPDRLSFPYERSGLGVVV